MIALNIKGYFDMTILNFHTKEKVEKDIEQGVLDNLQQGEYVIGINTKTIVDINDLETPLYSFELDPDANVEYDFDEA